MACNRSDYVVNLAEEWRSGAASWLPAIKRAWQSPTNTYARTWCPLSCTATGAARNIPAPAGYNATLSVRVATGGACATPFDLVISNGLSYEGPGGGGED